jgi:hypothetical protein
MKFSVAVFAFATLLVAVCAQRGFNNRRCTATGRRCAGANGKPFVKVRSGNRVLQTLLVSLKLNSNTSVLTLRRYFLASIQ